MKKSLLFAALLLASWAMPSQALAQCPGASFRTAVVTYYEAILPASSTDSRCDYKQINGKKVCHIRMRGVLHYPFYVNQNGQPPHQFPALVLNHGSEETFAAQTKGCAIAEYFVPKGYIVFLPFRRGHGDGNDPADRSTGRYVEDEVAACPPSEPSCSRVEVLRTQAKEDVAAGFNWLKNRADVKDDAMAIMGSSYGGRVTVFANDSQYSLGHKAVVAFSPAAQIWDTATNQTPIQTALIEAVKQAKEPAFYLQARWDYDTRPTIDLAYAHAYGGSDDQHGRRFMASIFEYPKPDIDPSTGELDFQSVHVGFARDTARWGPTVLDFLKRNGVE
ncbi:MAG: hypothetical protein M3X11_04925 [Acidobacteriota bacterium]|nr:hypothetical protein [Acidobacteriota bacterium]